MIPYDSFTYFGLLLYPAAAAVLVGLVGLRGPWRTWAIVLISAAVLSVQFANPLGDAAARASGLRQLRFLGWYTLESMILIGLLLLLRRRGSRPLPYWLAVALALAPLVAVKFQPLLLAHLGPHAAPISPLLAAANRLHTPPRTGVTPGSSPGILNPTTGYLALPAGLFDTLGFLGISYMTFRVLDVIILIQDGIVREFRPGELLAYLTFFPTISAGPIDRYRRFAADLQAGPSSRGDYLRHVETGIHRTVQGLLYKFIIATLIQRYWLIPASVHPGAWGQVDYMYAYSLYLFFDFAGYSAFAIGTGHLLGITVPENFAGPFLARNFREIWNRWFITLSWWLRDHVYMRFVLGATRRKWFGGNRYAASYVGFLLTMGLMGLWHGPTAYYLVYGLYQGVMLIAYDFLARWNKRRRLVPSNLLTECLSVFVTFNLFCFSLLIFSGHLFQ